MQRQKSISSGLCEITFIDDKAASWFTIRATGFDVFIPVAGWKSNQNQKYNQSVSQFCVLLSPNRVSVNFWHFSAPVEHTQMRNQTIRWRQMIRKSVWVKRKCPRNKSNALTIRWSREFAGRRNMLVTLKKCGSRCRIGWAKCLQRLPSFCWRLVYMVWIVAVWRFEFCA